MIDTFRLNAPKKYSLQSQMILTLLLPTAIAGIYFVTRWLMEEVPPPPPQESHFYLPPKSSP